MADEACGSVQEAAAIVAAEAADVLCIKLYKHGGITPARKIAAIAEAANLKINCGGLAVLSQLEAAAGAHFYASRPAEHVMPAGEFIFGLGVIGPTRWCRRPSSWSRTATCARQADRVLASPLMRSAGSAHLAEGNSAVGRRMDATSTTAVARQAAAEWVSGLKFDRHPAGCGGPHQEPVSLISLGCGLFGAAQPWGVFASNVAVAMSGEEHLSLFARPETVSPADAALANGTAIHGFELDDAHVSSSHHPGAATVPAVLAVAEARDASGRGRVGGTLLPATRLGSALAFVPVCPTRPAAFT